MITPICQPERPRHTPTPRRGVEEHTAQLPRRINRTDTRRIGRQERVLQLQAIKRRLEGHNSAADTPTGGEDEEGVLGNWRAEGRVEADGLVVDLGDGC